jgi:signal transduction histidine kinase
MVGNQQDNQEDEATPPFNSQTVDVLLVEDNPADAYLVKLALGKLTRNTFQVTHIDNIKEAIAYLDDHKPDVLLLDLNVGESRGYETFKVIQQHTQREIPIVISTGLEDDEMALRAIQAGAQDYYPKELTKTTGVLARILRHAIQRQQDREQLRVTHAKLESREQDLERTLVDLKEAQLSLVEAEKMKTIGRLAAGVAHEVKNPLQIIKMGMNYISKHLPQENDNCTMIANDIMVAVDRARDIIGGLLDFGAPKELERECIPLMNVVTEAYHMARHEINRTNVKYAYAPEPDILDVAIDKQKIVQVVVNLIINACHAMEETEDGQLTIRAMHRPMEEVRHLTRKDKEALVKDQRDVILIEVSDNGPGIPEDMLPKLFEPFFTTKSKGKGTGLGLCVCRLIMEMHEGGLTMENQAEGGAVARAWWPIKQKC